MKNNNFWFISLIALLIIGNSTGWSIYSRIAVVANAMVVLLEVVQTATHLYKSRKATSKKRRTPCKK